MVVTLAAFITEFVRLKFSSTLYVVFAPTSFHSAVLIFPFAENSEYFRIFKLPSVTYSAIGLLYSSYCKWLSALLLSSVFYYSTVRIITNRYDCFRIFAFFAIRSFRYGIINIRIVFGRFYNSTKISIVIIII